VSNQATLGRPGTVQESFSLAFRRLEFHPRLAAVNKFLAGLPDALINSELGIGAIDAAGDEQNP
jgi:hypothetical protein